MARAASAAFFDLDKTVIARSSTFAFSRPFYAGGLINRRAVLRSTYAHFLYLVGGADHDQMERMRQYLSAMVAGWEVQQVRDVRYTGEIAFYAYGENKATAVRELARAHAYRLEDSYAYSDSATDLPML